jgi:hypothetical protein
MSNIIYTIKTAELDNETWWTVTLPTIEAYALRIGAELKVITQAISTDIPNPYFLKFDCFRDFVTTAHDRMLYVDLDVFINDFAPNIFDEIQSGFHVRGSRNENNKHQPYYSWLSQNGSQTQGKQLLNNCGVMLADKQEVLSLLSVLPPSLKDFYDNNRILDTSDLLTNKLEKTEELCLTLFLDRSGILINNLSMKWNRPFRNDSGCYFAHYMGSTKKRLVS